MFPVVLWSSRLVQWCLNRHSLSPCNPSSTQQAAQLGVAVSSRYHLIRENRRKCEQTLADLLRHTATRAGIDPGRMSRPNGYLISFRQQHWLTDGKGGSEAGLRSDHLPISTRGTAPTQSLRQRRVGADRWIIQIERQQQDNNEQTEKIHQRPLSQAPAGCYTEQ